VDPIQPITRGTAARVPVQKVERITREHDRPSAEQRERERRKQDPPQPPPRDGEDEDGHRHVDVRV
jgi:hypothetical protein